MKSLGPLILICLLVACHQKKAEPREEINFNDTSFHLNMPKPANLDFDSATAEDHKRSIDISGDRFLLTFNGRTDSLNDISSLQQYCMNNRRSLNAQKFSLIADSATSYRLLVDVLDVFTTENIINFKIVRSR